MPDDDAPIDEENPSVYRAVKAGNVEIVKGLPLRDWFAGQALAGCLASDRNPHPEFFARSAYQYADAMLAEREKCHD